MRSATNSKLDLAYSQHVPRACRFAFVMGADNQMSSLLAIRAFRRSMGTFQELRGPDVLEAHILRRVISGIHRAQLLGRLRAGTGLGKAWIRLPVRTRAALVLAHLEDAHPARIADVLECSDSTVKALIRRGLRALGEHLGEADAENRLRTWLGDRAEDCVPAPGDLGDLRRSVGTRRVLTVIGALALALLVAGGGVAATNIALRQATKPSAEDALEPDAEPGSSRIAELARGCPSIDRLLPLPRKSNRAAEVARRFNEALIGGDRRMVLRLAEPSARPTRGTWAATETHRGIVVTSVERVKESDVFTLACGRRITERSIRVNMHDRNGVTSRGLAFFYLAFTPDGWRVWAALEPRS